MHEMQFFFHIGCIKSCADGEMIISFFSKNDSNARLAYVELDVAFRIGFGLERLGR